MRTTPIAIVLLLAASALISAGSMCTVNDAPVDCGSFGNPNILGVSTGPSRFWSGDGFGISLSLEAWASTDPQNGIFSTSAFNSWALKATTPGPVRPGVVYYSVATDGDSGAGAFFNAVASISGLARCFGMSCFQKGQGGVHITLGVPFEVTLDASAGADSTYGDYTGAGAVADLAITFFDSSGAHVPIVPAPEVTIPEPSQLGYMGVVLLVPAILKKRTGPPRPEWPH